MPLTKALKSFRGRYGLIRAGTTFQCEPGYFAALEKKGWVQKVEDRDPPGPSDNRSVPAAPNQAGAGDQGKASAAQGGEKSPSTGAMADTEPEKITGRRRGGGKALTSRSLRQDLRSPGKTATSSAAGETNPETKDNPGDE